MKANELVQFMSMVEEVFPTPSRDEFKGNQALVLTEDKQGISLVLWYKREGDDQLVTRSLNVTGEEAINKELLERAKEVIKQLDDKDLEEQAKQTSVETQPEETTTTETTENE